jgi:putative transposase
MQLAQDMAGDRDKSLACEALGLGRASFYRRLAPTPAPRDRMPVVSPRALLSEERAAVLDHLNSKDFQDKAPAEVYATLLDNGSYLCSVSTMYRILRKQDMVRERRNQVRNHSFVRPELLATGPNELWSWDITKLLGSQKWTYYHLYVIMDVFSRLVVGWLLAPRESAGLATDLIEKTCFKQNIGQDQLTVHADRGSSMMSKSVASLLADLGVTKTHSRPHVSNDNSYSESQFKTMKYRPTFPERFGSIEDARVFCRDFFAWYNNEHRHSGIAMLTPQTVHYGQADAVIAARAAILTAAHVAHPERFVRKHPVPEALPKAVWINPPITDEASRDASGGNDAASGPRKRRACVSAGCARCRRSQRCQARPAGELL